MVGKYDLDFKNPGGKQQLSGPELIQLYKDLAAKYPIVSIEDPFDQVCLLCVTCCDGGRTSPDLSSCVYLLTG